MPGGDGALRIGGGGAHRPLTGCINGKRTARMPAHGYGRGHPSSDADPNPPTYQTARQLGHDHVPMQAAMYRSTRSLHGSGLLTRSSSLPSVGRGLATPVRSFSELHAQRLVAPLSHISPW